MHRHHEYTEEIGQAICEWIANGGSLNRWCAQEGNPCRMTVYNWLLRANNGEKLFVTFLDNYNNARELQADTHWDECIDIADNSKYDIKTEDGKIVVDHENIQRSKLRVDTRMKLAGQQRPKKYGINRTDITSGDAAFMPVVQVYIDGKGAK